MQYIFILVIKWKDNVFFSFLCIIKSDMLIFLQKEALCAVD